MTPKKALLVVSDEGFHWDELADAYHAFDDAHWQIEVASPRGHPKAEPLSLRTNWLLHLLGRGTTRSRSPKSPWWGRPVVEAIMRARRLEALEPRNYDAVYVAGGLGDVADIERNATVARLLKMFREDGMPIGGRARVLGTYEGMGGDESGVILSRWPRGGRRVAWRLIERLTRLEDLHGWRHLPEFLDRKSGRVSGRGMR